MAGFLKFSGFKRIQRILATYWIVGHDSNGSNFQIKFSDFYKQLELSSSGTGGTPIFFDGLQLPNINNEGESLKKGDWAFLPGGKTFVNIAGGANITTPLDRFSIAQFDGVKWVLVDMGALPSVDISGKVDKSSVKISNIDIPLYENLFDKSTMVKDGYELNQNPGEPGWIININTTATEIIPVNPNYPIFANRGWTGSPGYMIFYGKNGEVIHKASVASTFNSGLINQNTNKNIYGVSANIYNANIAGLSKQGNIDSFMIYSGEAAISDYKEYVSYFNEIDGKKILYNFKEIYEGLEAYEDVYNRELGYTEAVNVLPKDSRLNDYSKIVDGYIGDWQIRKTEAGGTTVVKNPDGSFNFKTDGSAANMGLLYQFFFRASDVGKTLFYDFKARSISGKNELTLYAAASTAGNFKTITIPASWGTVKGSVVVGSQNLGNDWRLLLGVAGKGSSSVAEFEIKDINLYFTEPVYNEEEFKPNYLPMRFGDTPIFKDLSFKILAGANITLVIGLLGDSWTDHVPGSIMYARDLSRLLRAYLGNGGGGFYDFAQNSGNNQKHGSIDPDDADDTRGGNIVYHDSLANAKWVNINHALFNNGDWLNLNIKTNHTRLVIKYYGGAIYGSFTYSLDGAAPVSVNTSTSSGIQNIVLDVPDSTHSINFACTSGQCIIFGVDMQRDGGVRVHKLGNRGLHAYHYSIVNEDDWKASFASLGIDVATLLIGTNDRTTKRSPADFKTYVKKAIDMVKDVDSDIDFTLISPSNNQYDLGYTPMDQYVQQLFDLAQENDLSFLNLMYLFGSSQKIINKNLFSDVVHPTTNMGNVIANKIFEFLKN